MKASLPLSSAARELLELGSQVEPPSTEQCERMDRALAPLFALDRVAPPPAASLSQGTALGARGLHGRASGPAWGPLAAVLGSGAGKLALGLGALAATAGASFWVGRVSAPVGAEHAPGGAALAALPIAQAFAPAVPAAAPGDRALLDARALERRADAPLADAPLADVPTGGAKHAATSAAPPEAVRVGASRAKSLLARPSTLAARAPSVGLAAEIERLARAEAALRQGRAQPALAELEQPAVHLVEQAAALRAIAECTLDRAAGAASAREVLQRWPASAFAPRVSAACGL